MKKNRALSFLTGILLLSFLSPLAGNTLTGEPRNVVATGAIELDASDVAFSQVTDASMRVIWQPGNGDGVLVLVKAGSPVDAIPEDGSTYNASSIFGSGEQLGTDNYVVYQGSGSFVEITGLSPGTPYHVAVYEYAGSGSKVEYQPSPARGIRTTAAGSVRGKVFTITIYSPFRETTTSTLSFFNDGFLQFSAFKGFGLYGTAGTLFWGSYWIPDYNSTDLLISFSGFTFGSYLIAAGTASNLTRAGPWFCLGHAN